MALILHDVVGYSFPEVAGIVGRTPAACRQPASSARKRARQLVRAGYLERRPNPSDARSRLVLLTPRGEAARPVAVAAGEAVEDRWAELVGPEEFEDLRTGLRSLLERLRRAGTIEDGALSCGADHPGRSTRDESRGEHHDHERHRRADPTAG